MKTKNLIVLAVAAVVLGGAACLLRNGAKGASPRLNGMRMVDAFSAADVARIEIGEDLVLAAGDGGWMIESMQGYPADRSKIIDALMRLGELKVGQIAKGVDLGKKTCVTIRDGAGRELAALTLGDRRERRGLGRYAEFRGETVLVGDTLDVFDGDAKKWCETKIIDEPWVSFSSLAEPTLSEEDFGFATGVVKTVTIGADTNRLATVGAVAKDGSSRYLRLDGAKWTYVIPSYAAEKLLPKPPPEPSADENETDGESAGESAD